MRRKREAFDPTDDLFEGLPSAKHAAIRLRDDSGDSDSSHADADGAASEAIVEPAADSVPVAETAARLSAREPSAASSAQGVTDEAGLPLWMRTAAARIIGDHTPPISALALDRRLEAALGRMGVRRCFPVQAAVVPMVLASAASSSAGDICCCAPTGSGKTLAYSLPLLQHLLGKSAVRRLRALVLLPTRALAMQAGWGGGGGRQPGALPLRRERRALPQLALQAPPPSPNTHTHTHSQQRHMHAL